MKYAFVSDIHGNIQAWQAVWADTRAHGADMVACLGDIVGYGPRPAETLNEVYRTTDYFVLGNHDAAAAGIFDDSLFNDEAQRMIAWTKAQLGPKAIEFFTQLPYALEIDTGSFPALCVHGSAYQPQEFNYILDAEDARRCWAACDHYLIFIGHTHEPGVFIRDADGSIRFETPNELTLKPGHRYIVNAGSVGMPRTRDFRACYAMYHTTEQVVRWHRTAYDVSAFNRDVQERLGDAGRVNELLAAFDRDRVRQPRSPVDFSAHPPGPETRRFIRRADSAPAKPSLVLNNVSSALSQSLETSRRDLQRKRTAADRRRRRMLIAVTGGALIGALAATLVFTLRHHAQRRAPPPPPENTAAARAPEREDGLVLHWRFDGDLRDSAGSLNAKPSSPPEYVDGPRNQALRLTAAHRIHVDRDILEESDQLTIAFWLYLRALPPNRGVIFNAKSYLQLSDGHPELYLPGVQTWSGDIDPTTKGLNYSLAGETGRWLHLAVTYDRYRRTAAYYINGRLVGEIVFGENVRARLNGPAWLGDLDADIDDFRIYRRVLTVERLAELARWTRFQDGQR